MKPETRFRVNRVQPFLDRLPNTEHFSIQQRTISGDPDKLLCIRGRFVALEIKSEGNEARPLQAHKLDKIRKAGGVSIVVSPENWDEVKTQLLALAQGDTSWSK